jgi:hypothetical protein
MNFRSVLQMVGLAGAALAMVTVDSLAEPVDQMGKQYALDT